MLLPSATGTTPRNTNFPDEKRFQRTTLFQFKSTVLTAQGGSILAAAVAGLVSSALMLVVWFVWPDALRSPWTAKLSGSVIGYLPDASVAEMRSLAP